MHASYEDIVSRISTPPIWYDEHAVPRYCTFEPHRSASIHIGEIALTEISCQQCKRRFLVAISAVNFNGQTIAEAIQNKTLRYGDPPRHDFDRAAPYPECGGGDTMNSEPRRVLEYWRRHDRSYVEGGIVTNMDYFRWVRDPVFEVDIQPDWVR
jgi:hypothetical protein